MLSNQFVVATFLALISYLTPANARCKPPPLKRDDPAAIRGVQWRIKTVDPASQLNGRDFDLQMTPDRGIAVSDSNAPLAITNFHDGELHLGSALQNSRDVGPTAYLNLTTPGSDKMDRYQIGFANVTSSFYATTANGSVDKGWAISEIDPDYPKRKKLSHTLDADLVGFSLCYGGVWGRSNTWYYIYLLAGSKDKTWDNNGCENNVTIWTMGEELPPDDWEDCS
ncbi:hypothetical protein F5Y06DRAFT_301841 [Hypoxylon sp. FL0890]|nr:hypothetical protein F5Y06DRAFT_301841 [Hypoxylon sp. FL0890]